jgi:hypothetical protein
MNHLSNIKRFDSKDGKKKLFVILGIDYGGNLELMGETVEHILAKIPGSSLYHRDGGQVTYYHPKFAIFRTGVLRDTVQDYNPVWEKEYDRKTRMAAKKEASLVFEKMKKIEEETKHDLA